MNSKFERMRQRLIADGLLTADFRVTPEGEAQTIALIQNLRRRSDAAH